MILEKNIYIRVISIATLVVMLSSCSKMYLSKGKEDYDNYNYVDAIESLEKSVEKKSSVEGSTLLAKAYSKTGQPIAAIAQYEKVLNDPAFNDSLRMDYAGALLSAKKYSEAGEIANGVLSRDPGNEIAQSIKISANRVGKMKRDSSLFQLTHKSIPDLAEAMSPVPYNNGTLIVSGEKNNVRVKDEYTGYSYLDLYEVSSDGSITKFPVSSTKYHDGMPTFNSDKTEMYFTRTNVDESADLTYNAQNISHPQIYHSKKSGEDWSNPVKLEFNDQNYKYAHPWLSEDGKTLYFASNKAGGIGGMDLYKSTKSGDTWSTPSNLGSDINTPGNEVFPTLKDNNTLYFSSDAHQTLGGLDLMYSQNTGGNWGEPVHLSYPINSSFDDFSLVYTEKDKGLLASDREGNDKIYEFEQFYPELVIDGKTITVDTGEPIPGIQITVKNLTDNTTDVITADENGKFNYELLPNKDYEIIAEDIGEEQEYFNASKKISTMGLREDETFTIDFNLEKIKIVDPTADPYDISSLQPNEDGIYPNS